MVFDVSSRTPHSRGPRAGGDGERGADAVVVVVDQDDDVHLAGRSSREGLAAATVSPP